MGTTTGHTSLRVFAGPKVLDVLASVKATVNGAPAGPNLEAVVNYGYAGIIAKPLFLALRWVHEHVVSNWGWAILVLTLLINLAMLPTRIQMMKSALKMQRIQPEMNSIKEKYKKYKATDPRRADMNKEMFDLQKREGREHVWRLPADAGAVAVTVCFLSHAAAYDRTAPGALDVDP